VVQMNITIVGTGYVGLVTGICLSEIGHHVTCVDIDQSKIETLRKGISPIYEPGLGELLARNIEQGRLTFTAKYQEAFEGAEVIYITVGTPTREGGKTDLSQVENVAKSIAKHIQAYKVIVTKSTVPVGTNHHIKELIMKNMMHSTSFDIVSNPEFLREGSAIHDTFHGDRIVIGADNEKASSIIEEINKPFGIPILKTDIRSAEMIKYASNAFLATKISFINEVANLCEKLGANIEDVAQGMGQDQRIGPQFLHAGIGYGGSCFPKDTKALVQMAGNVEHDFELLKAVVNVNNTQQLILVEKAKARFGSLKGKQIALLGLSYKPNTDDMREAASIVISERLVEEGATVVAYDPVAMENAKKVLREEVQYADSIEDSLQKADCAFILTEWDEIKNFDLAKANKRMKEPIIFDGRNCFSIEETVKNGVEYYSVGRPYNNFRNKAWGDSNG
jgi:UDPglucose 6-dehydrogenase